MAIDSDTLSVGREFRSSGIKRGNDMVRSGVRKPERLSVQNVSDRITAIGPNGGIHVSSVSDACAASLHLVDSAIGPLPIDTRSRASRKYRLVPWIRTDKRPSLYFSAHTHGRHWIPIHPLHLRLEM